MVRHPPIRATLLLFAFLGFVAPPATVAGAAEEAASPAAEPELPKYTSRLRLAEQVTLAALSNGLTVIVQENHVAPVATVRCYVKNTGSAFEGRYLGAGLSHVLEHVVAGGTTTRRTEKEIEQIIDSFGGATNAYTSSQMTAYYVDCPAGKVDQAMELVADSMQHVAFEPAEFERELAVVRRELADGEVSRSRVMWKLLGETIYKVHPARVPVIGYLDVLSRTGNQTIIDFYRQRYVPNNQVFVVVGDVDADEVLDCVPRLWAGTLRGRETVVAMPDEPRQIVPREAQREMDGSTYDLVLAWPTVRLSDPDLYALDLAAYILAEGDSSRLVRRLKYDLQLVLSIRSASYTPHFVDGWFGVFASATPENWQKAIDEIRREVYRLCDEPVGPAELEKAKKQKAAELVFGQQTVQQAAESLAQGFLATGDPLFDKAYVENIQKVTAEEIRDVARRYFVAGRLNRVVIAPPGEAAGADRRLTAAAEGDVRLVRLENGLRVLVKRHANLPMVNLQAFVLGGGLVDSRRTAGRSKLVADMLDKGTPNRSAQEIAEYFDSIGGRFGASAGRSTVFASATLLSDDFPEAARLFAECFLQPTFPADEFEKVKALALGAIARRANDPRQEAFDLFYENLPAGSPYHVNPGGTADSVGALSVDDLKAYHAGHFVPQNMIVAVFGDVDPDRAVELVRESFGRLAPAPDFRPIALDRPNALGEDVARHKQTGKPTGMVILGYCGTSILSERDHAAMTVLDAIISGYSYPGGWLHNELRGEGLVYYVHALQMTGPASGYFIVMAQTDPEKIDEVVGRIRKSIERVKAGEIDQQEFLRAKQMIIALHAQENTTISEQAQQAALDELYGLGYNHDKTFDARINAVTLPDVTRVAQKHLTHSLLVTTSPSQSP